MTYRWSTAVPDWERRVTSGETMIPFDPLFPDEADAALEILNDLICVDVAGKPRFSESPIPWMLDFASVIFGAYDADEGRRYINEFFLLIAKKNGKSWIAAAIMLVALLRNWRDSAEFYIISPTIEASQNAWRPIRDMIQADPELGSLLHIQAQQKVITHRVTKATLAVLSADGQTVVGKKGVGVFVDELWEFGKRSGAADMLREATGGLASRPEGFVIYASTQSTEAPAGVFRDRLEFFRSVRDGVVSAPSSLPVIYEFPKRMVDDGAHLDPENWWMVNPSLGIAVDEPFLRNEYAKAEVIGGETLTSFIAKHLNVQQGTSLKAGRWAGADSWDEAADRSLDIVSLLDRSEVVVVGIDCGGLDDLLGLTVMGREIGTRRWLSWSHGWVTKKQLERRKLEAARLKDSEKDGDLTFVETTDEAASLVCDIIDGCFASGKMPEKDAVGLDPVGAGQITDELVSRGFDDTFFRGIRQGWELASAIRTTERAIEDGVIIHADQPIMAWCVSNAKVEQKGNAVLVTKQAAGAGKIDLLLSFFDAAALMAKSPVAKVKPRPRIHVV